MAQAGNRLLNRKIQSNRKGKNKLFLNFEMNLIALTTMKHDSNLITFIREP